MLGESTISFYWVLCSGVIIILMKQLTIKTNQSTITPAEESKGQSRRQNNLIRQNLQKQLGQLKLNLQPYKQKQLLLQEKTNKKMSKNYVSTITICNLQIDISSLNKVESKIHSTSNTATIFQDQNFNLFQNQTIVRTQYKFPKILPSLRAERSKSCYNLSHKEIVLRYATPIASNEEQMLADLKRFHSISKSLTIPKKQKDQVAPTQTFEKKRIRQIVIYQKGSPMKNKN